MSNIVSFDEVRRKHDQDDRSQPRPSSSKPTSPPSNPLSSSPSPSSNFTGASRRVDGTPGSSSRDAGSLDDNFGPAAAHNPAPLAFPVEPPDYLIEPDTDAQRAELLPPPELAPSFWSPNAPPPTDFNIETYCKYGYCPCCIGPGCSDARKNDYKRLLKSGTFWVLLIQIILYIATVSKSTNIGWMLEPSTDVLLEFGANSRSKIQCLGHVHRLFGYILLHGSIIHILCNGLSQFLMVLPMESSWGFWKWLLIFVVTGLTGGLVSDMRNVSVSVGASCSIFGVMGAHLVVAFVLWKGLHPIFKQQLMLRMVMVPALFFVVSFLPSVDWLGHLGGLLGGLAIGAVLFAGLAEDDGRKRWLRFGGGGALLLLFLVPLLVIYLTNTGACE
jgi:membrane associated rhomboid family serine protease